MMRKQNQRLRQVAATLVGGSLRNCAFWGWLIMAGTVAVLAAASPARSLDPASLPSPGSTISAFWGLCVFLTGMFAPLMLVSYLGNYRWRLVPHYRQIYLAAAGALAAGLLVSAGAVFLLISTERPLSGIGLGFLMFALGCWTIAYAWVSYLVVAWLTAATLLVWPAQLYAAAQTGPGNVAAAVVGGLLLVWLGRRLARLDEDDPIYNYCRLATYFTMLRVPRARSIDAGLQQGAGVGWGLMLRLQDWRLERALRRGPGGFAWKVRRWDLVSFPSLFFVVLAAGMDALAVAAARLFGGPVVESITVPALWGMTAAAMILLVGIRHRPTRGIESLRPAKRSDLVRQWGCGLLAQLAGLLAVNAMLTVFAFGWPLGSASAGAIAWWSLWMALPFALAGLLVWLRTIGTIAFELIALGCGLAVLAAAMILPAAARPRWPVDPLGLLPAASVALLLVGAALFWGAYRRWLVIDLE